MSVWDICVWMTGTSLLNMNVFGYDVTALFGAMLLTKGAVTVVSAATSDKTTDLLSDFFGLARICIAATVLCPNNETKNKGSLSAIVSGCCVLGYCLGTLTKLQTVAQRLAARFAAAAGDVVMDME